MSLSVANMIDDGEEGGDVRRPSNVGAVARDGQVLQDGFDATRTAHAHDPSISFEEYVYYSEITRAEEETANAKFIEARGPQTFLSIIKDRFSTGKAALESHGITSAPGTTGKDGALSEKITGTELAPISDEKRSNGSGNPADPADAVMTGVTPDEWKQASRALRTAGWGGVFYLITTDILGPFSTPWAFAQMGYGPGITLYTVFGVMSLYSGWIVYRAYLDLDSDRYPLKGYGDLYFRVFGPTARHVINIAQSIQLLLTVSILILSNGQSISQISQGPSGGAGICFVACLVIFMAAGFILGQIRTLQRFSWIANASVYINLLILFICMGVAANTPPNFAAAQASFGIAPGPILKFGGTPPDGLATGGSGFIGSLNGLNQAIYSYGGCMIFVAFLAEMRHPRDFWKSLLVAEIFIYVVYMFFGLFVYSYQGQYSFNPVMQGLSPYNWQTATNIMNIITGLIAAALYGNIGIKVFYVEVLQELFNFPALTVRIGQFLWIFLVPVYWAVAFIVGAAIPQFSSISSLVGALFILSFTYTFPAFLAVGFFPKKDAITPEERFNPDDRSYSYIDAGLRRWARGFSKRPIFNTWNIIYTLGSLATTALGVYSSVESLITAFSGGSVATSFGCASPV